MRLDKETQLDFFFPVYALGTTTANVTLNAIAFVEGLIHVVYVLNHLCAQIPGT
jgi:uncharacterized membrane protein YqaE (UPF0057 family)